MITVPISILKSLWSRGSDGRWAITGAKGLELKPRAGSDSTYFVVDGNDMELMSQTLTGNIHEIFAASGPTDFLMKQSVLPVVAWKDGDSSIRCVGTASIISCTGYVITAAHVLLDPYESGYGAVRRGDQLEFSEELNFGVFMPTSPAYGTRVIRFLPFQKFWLWGTWKESPLITERDVFELVTDIAVCKIPEMPHGAAHQPFNLSLNPFVSSESAYALGYAEMEDIPIENKHGQFGFDDFPMDLYASLGEVMSIFSENHLRKDVTTPGPCFDFKAKIPGKMSGAPIFGAQGAVIRGVVSRSFSGERHAYGAMLGPAMHMGLDEPQICGRTLRTLMESANEGIAQIRGAGL